MNNDEDFEFSSPMEEAAIGMHEVYTTLKKAGFSRRDALELVAKLLFMGMTEDISAKIELIDDDDDEDDD